jgi:multiple sugar transport system ATP-binding protein
MPGTVLGSSIRRRPGTSISTTWGQQDLAAKRTKAAEMAAVGCWKNDSAGVEGATLHLPIGDIKLTREMADEVEGREILIAGARPEHFEDATLLDDARRSQGLTFEAHVDVIEWLGAEQYAYIPFEAPEEVRAPLAELATELDMEQIRTQLVVILDADSQVSEGENASLWLDPSRMHLFDPASGENLTHGRGTEARTLASA